MFCWREQIYLINLINVWLQAHWTPGNWKVPSSTRQCRPDDRNWQCSSFWVRFPWIQFGGGSPYSNTELGKEIQRLRRARLKEPCVLIHSTKEIITCVPKTQLQLSLDSAGGRNGTGVSVPRHVPSNKPWGTNTFPQTNICDYSSLKHRLGGWMSLPGPAPGGLHTEVFNPMVSLSLPQRWEQLRNQHEHSTPEVSIPNPQPCSFPRE